MIPLLLCSVLALAIIIEKAYTLRGRRVINPEIAGLVEHMHGGEDALASIAVCERVDSPFARVIKAGLANRSLPRTENVEMVQSTARREVGSLERGLLILEIITGISPLLGLLGTVLGIFHVFNVIVERGVGEASILSGGISEALITTIVGLFIAIPSLVAHSYFSKRVDDLVLEFERYANMLTHKLYAGETNAARERLGVEQEEFTR
ncbi:MAG: MotA/TolQ/ExbB proton channel family protein [Candidatus Abyssobacteria bacterium SURF_17]|uniref:MotA/TolQ/ExbB proton channel family protein n=1 Tax=Candidatus Abyssobacteria bacterium SURF_17 TaxID=2093361 RepID=A0A419EQD7_9BACT|nr:MAG: MotA/TolQ/ExbB proton channel family protein [Candidatus Abyssubacteria bacterium SURF_17]